MQFGEERPAALNFHIDFNPALQGAATTNATQFTVEPGMNVLDIFATVDTIAEEGTGNTVGLRATSPSGVGYSTAIDIPVIGSTARQIVVQNPEAGVWTLEVRGARTLAAAPQASLPVSAAAPGPVDGSVSQIKYILPNIADINGHPLFEQIDLAIKNRVIDVNSDGTFAPDQIVNRADFARSLALNTALRQVAGANARFNDVSGDLARIAEAVTAKGSTNRDFNFAPNGLLAANGSSFNPNGSISRIDLAVAFIRALGHDEAARALANTNVTINGATVSDNQQIPGALRGYVQLAINKGLLETYEASVTQLPNGQFVALPGPRVEPGNTVTRAVLAQKLNRFRTLFNAGE